MGLFRPTMQRLFLVTTLCATPAFTIGCGGANPPESAYNEVIEGVAPLSVRSQVDPAILQDPRNYTGNAVTVREQAAAAAQDAVRDTVLELINALRAPNAQTIVELHLQPPGAAISDERVQNALFSAFDRLAALKNIWIAKLEAPDFSSVQLRWQELVAQLDDETLLNLVNLRSIDQENVNASLDVVRTETLVREALSSVGFDVAVGETVQVLGGLGSAGLGLDLASAAVDAARTVGEDNPVQMRNEAGEWRVAQSPLITASPEQALRNLAYLQAFLDRFTEIIDDADAGMFESPVLLMQDIQVAVAQAQQQVAAAEAAGAFDAPTDAGP